MIPTESGDDQVGFTTSMDKVWIDPLVEGGELGVVLCRQGEQINIRKIFRRGQAGKYFSIEQRDVVRPKLVTRNCADALKQGPQGGGIPDFSGISRGTENSEKGILG